MSLRLSWLPICYLFVQLVVGTFTSRLVQDNPTYYEVELGDTLYKIAADFGSKYDWVQIYQANRNTINDPDLIYPGQKLKIPPSIANSKTEATQNDSVFTKNGGDSLKTSQPKTEKTKALQEFRKAFNAVVKKEKKQEQAKPQKSSGQEVYSGLGLGGMVLDETRTKMGRDFYSIFYKYWETPEQAKNFTITISEQPVPSRGTMVNIEINDQLVFRNRLEPRYHKTKKKARQAVSICQKKILRLAGNQNELAGY
ncbi:MAG: CsgE family curli-type amyloid fiber assembly protein [Balneolaceae bacterium]|nr:CsgE family curli-type amyloid fiber assembly protein [Balneolaceae bacterium]